MRKGYGTLLATIIAFSVLLGPRPNTPAGPAAGQGNSRRADLGTPTADRFLNENFTTCKTDGDTKPPCNDCNPFCPAKDLLDAIQAHYGEVEGGTEKKVEAKKSATYSVAEHWGVPKGENTKILFVIATVPDPIYTHLSLFFDRNIDSIIKGAQASDFFFSRATMPWDNDEHPDSADIKLRTEEQVYREHREDFPGLMIFRAAPEAEGGKTLWHVEKAETLFVLVVGETPTGGIRKGQFKNALRMIREIRGDDEIDPNLKNLRILGTTFSGSLASLKQILEQELGQGSEKEFPRILIHSGTASGWEATEDFRKFLKTKQQSQDQLADGKKQDRNLLNDKGRNAEFVTFQESDQYADEHFCRYMTKQGYEASDMAILSEDETAYGNISRKDSSKRDGEQAQPAAQQVAKQQKGSDNANPSTDCRGPMVRLYFPRDISQLRAAYQRELKIQNSTGNSQNAPKLTLPLNLDTTGSDGDSVPPYATLQTPLSQESVLVGVVANLRKHHIRVVLLRATSSLDTLFLCQFLRTSYSDARIVTIGSDLLYQRDFDKPSLHGILSITNYPLLPGIDDEVAQVSEAKGSAHEDRVFSDSYGVGVFNAYLSLVADGSSEIPAEKQKDNAQRSREHRPMVLPVARYEQFGWPAISGKDAGHGLTPPLWLTVNGRGGAWPVALLDEDAGSEADQRLQPSSNLDAILLKDKNASPSEGSAPASAPLEWQLAEIGALGLALLFSWFMAYPPRFPRSEALATFRLDEDDYRDRLLFAFGWLMIGVQCVFLYPWLSWGGREHQMKLFLGPALALVAVTAGCTIGLYLRGSRRLAKGFLLSSAIVLLALWHYLSPASLDADRRILLFRITHLASGNSPVLPVFFLLAAGTWWCWMSLTGIILRGKKGPCLPEDREFEGVPGLSSCVDRVRLKSLSNRAQAGLMRSLKPLGLEPRVLLPAAFVAWLMILVLGINHPVQALDGDHYEDFYGILLFAALFLLLNSVFRLVVVWIEFRSLLRTLEDLPLRRSFDRLKGFAWQSLWRVAGSAGSGLLNFYRLMSRELESLQKFLKLEAVTPTSPAEPMSYAEFIRCINETERQSDTLCESFIRGAHAPRGFWQRPDNSWQNLLESFHAQLAKTCAAALVYLSGKWNTERCPNAEELKEEQKKECDAAAENKRFCEPIPCPLTACAERFVCLFFLAYILVILQRIQTLVLSCAGIFLFILMSVNSYPFEPHLRLRSLLVALFFVILGGVGLVYSGMHRNATLSRITDTKPGELGIAFWIRMGAFIVVPALGLLAAQFPEISGFLFSWLQPAAESLK